MVFLGRRLGASNAPWPLVGIQCTAIVLLAVTAAVSECAWGEEDPTAFNVAIDDATEVSVALFPGQGQVLIWLAPEYHVSLSAAQLARRLGARQNEIWIADLIAARFLPRAASSMSQVPGTDVVKIVEAAYERAHKPVYLVAADRAAGLVLRGVAEWQKRGMASPAIAGAILIHPYLYEGLPELGRDAEYLPAVREVKLPIFILQPKLSSGRWWLKRLQTRLQASGSHVFTLLVPAARDRFFFRPDTTYLEDAMTKLLPELLAMAASTLRSARGDAP